MGWAWPAKVIGVNALLVLAAYEVLSDLSYRVGYATNEGLSFAFSYSLLVRSSDLSGRGSQLVSPPTLDWIQVIILAAVVANAIFLSELLGKRRKGRAEAVQPAAPAAGGV